MKTPAADVRSEFAVDCDCDDKQAEPRGVNPVEHQLIREAFGQPSVVEAIFDLLAVQFPEIQSKRASATTLLRRQLPRLENFRISDLRKPLDPSESRPERLSKQRELFDHVVSCLHLGFEAPPRPQELAKRLRSEWITFVSGNAWQHYRQKDGPPEDASELHKLLYGLTQQSRGKALSYDHILEKISPKGR